ncbi:MAG: hypothetical protein GSR72_00345 [Desulfurococcales archaeon]|nr:hypothetical protein [Desulfurococcales archaeon]
MACPYAERQGAAVYCKVLRKRVNPLAYPCLSKKYEKCKVYQEKEKYLQETEPREQAEQVTVQAQRPRQERRIGIRLDGSPARHCRECIYYGRTGVCLLLGVEIKDPNNPPCRAQ